MVTVYLYSNSKSDNAGRMGNFSGLTAQNGYFNGLSGLTVTGTLSAGLGDMVIERPFTELLGYGYGRFQTGGKWIYFSVRDLEVVNPSKTRLYYDVDAWETARFQYPMGLGRATIYRSGRALDSRMVRPLSPVYTRTTVIRSLIAANLMAGLAFVHDDAEDTNYIYQTELYSNAENLGAVLDGSWLTKSGIENVNQVTGAWLSPWVLDHTEEGWESVGPTALPAYRINCENLHLANTTQSMSIGTRPVGDMDEVIGITDMRGNVIWTCDYSDDLPSTMAMYANISPSSCSWECRIGSSLEGRFTVPCEPTYYYSDTFVDYVSRQRAYDQQMRSLNNDRQLVGAVSGFMSNTIGGAVAGGNAGAAGAAVGGIMGGVGTIIGAAANYLIAPSFDRREQQITDEYYRKQADSLAYVGDSLISILKGDTGVNLVSISTDPTTRQVYDDAVAAAGYYYDSLEVSSASAWIVNGPLCADVEITGGIPSAWKEQIRNRFRNGVILS